MKGLPPLNPLRVFEAAARHGNFTRAAEELGISQSAVSRHVSVLEDYLGVQLFTRTRGEVILKPAALRYEIELKKAFDLIAAATQNIPNLPRRRAINVRALPAFMHTWLVPRIGDFRQMHPGIGINFTSSLSFAQLDRESVDIAIQGRPTEDQHGTLFEPLMQNRVGPVCSPEFIRKNGPIERLQDLSKLTILDSHYRSADWGAWLDYVGAPDIKLSNVLTFESSSMVYVATREGLGVAMAQLPLLQREIERGEIVQLFNRTLVKETALFSVCSPRSVNLSAVIAFRDWLKREAEISSEWFARREASREALPAA